MPEDAKTQQLKSQQHILALAEHRVKMFCQQYTVNQLQNQSSNHLGQATNMSQPRS